MSATKRENRPATHHRADRDRAKRRSAGVAALPHAVAGKVPASVADLVSVAPSLAAEQRERLGVLLRSASALREGVRRPRGGVDQ